MRRPSRVTIAAAPVLLGLVGNVATGLVEVGPRWKPWVGAATVVLAMLVIMIEFRRTGAITRHPRARVDLDEVAANLAQAVGTQWRREEAQQRIHDPYPLAIRWRSAAEHIIDHWANIRRAPAGADPGPLALEGDLGRIVGVYRRVPSGRLLVLGRAGSGKTVLTLRLLLDLIDARGEDDPVPVIFSLGSWNPGTTSLRDWLVAQLIRDHPGLAEPAAGGASLAAELTETGRILPLLDGFDEIASGLHPLALEALNATTMPVVVTSRIDEYLAAVGAGDVLSAAAGIELRDLTLDDLADYLRRASRKTASGGAATRWDGVLTILRADPNQSAARNLLGVLNTPLMVALARAVYSDAPNADPGDLLDTTRFPSRRSIEDHLFSAFVPAVYRQPVPDRHGAGTQPRHRWDADHAERALRYLAVHLNTLHTIDLAWWRIGDTLPVYARMLAYAVTGGGVLGVGLGLVSAALGSDAVHVARTAGTFGVGYGLVFGVVGGLGGGVLAGLAGGFAGGLFFWLSSREVGGFTLGFALGLASGLAFGPLTTRSRPVLLGRGRRGPDPHNTHLRRPGWQNRIMDGFAAGAGGGAMYGLPIGAVVAVKTGNVTAFAAVETLCVMVGGLTGGIVGAFEAPVDVGTAISPAIVYRADRRNAIFQAIVVGVVFGLASGALTALGEGWEAGGTVGLVFGLALGPLVGLGRSAWSRWLILVRLWLPGTGRLPWRVVEFLDDAYRRGVLRQAGAVYQFRHARIQDHLAYSEEPGNHAVTGFPWASRRTTRPAKR